MSGSDSDSSSSGSSSSSSSGSDSGGYGGDFSIKHKKKKKKKNKKLQMLQYGLAAAGAAGVGGAAYSGYQNHQSHGSSDPNKKKKKKKKQEYLQYAATAASAAGLSGGVVSALQSASGGKKPKPYGNEQGVGGHPQQQQVYGQQQQQQQQQMAHPSHLSSSMPTLSSHVAAIPVIAAVASKYNPNNRNQNVGQPPSSSSSSNLQVSIRAADLPTGGRYCNPIAILTHLPHNNNTQQHNTNNNQIIGKTEIAQNTNFPFFTTQIAMPSQPPFQFGVPMYVHVSIYNDVDSVQLGSIVFELGEVLGKPGSVMGKKLRHGGIIYLQANRATYPAPPEHFNSSSSSSNPLSSSGHLTQAMMATSISLGGGGIAPPVGQRHDSAPPLYRPPSTSSSPLSVSPQYRPSFIDYLTGGCQMNLCMAIDFSSSNGDYRIPGTLHHIPPQSHPQQQQYNQYQKAILGIGSVLAKYDTDQMFPVWGFGAVYGGMVRNCFQMGTQREVHGVQGVMDAYRNTLMGGNDGGGGEMEMSRGPTVLLDVISQAASQAKSAQQQQQQQQQIYTTLLILTNGATSTEIDIPSTKRLLHQISMDDCPLSIVIVGVGNGYDTTNREHLFTSMRRLDYVDDASRVVGGRDLVKFVEFQTHEHDVHSLTKATLEEIPNQLVDYFNGRNIMPGVATATNTHAAAAAAANNRNDHVHVNTFQESDEFALSHNYVTGGGNSNANLMVNTVGGGGGYYNHGSVWM